MGNTFVAIVKYIVTIIAVIAIILLGKSWASALDPEGRRAPPSNVTVVPSTPSTPGSPASLAVRERIYHLECGMDGTVVNAIFLMEISGGIPPYDVVFEPGDLVIPNIYESSVIFTLPAGKSLVVRVRSGTADGEPMHSRDIYAPLNHPGCSQALTASPTPSPTGTSTATGTPTPTATFFFVPTATRDLGPPDPATPATPTRISTGPPPGSTPTTVTNPPPSTPTIRPSNTSRPTNTPTDRPTATRTPIRGQLNECEDGEDNDEDGYIDLADPQCGHVNDNHENK